MAKMDFRIPEEFLDKLSKLNDRFDEIAPRVLEAGAQAVLEKEKANLKEVIGKNTKHKSKSTGQLLSSLRVSTAWQDREGTWKVSVGIGDSKDSEGVSNAMKGMVLEYGKSDQPPKPWLKPAKTASQKTCINDMKAKLESELNGI